MNMSKHLSMVIGSTSVILTTAITMASSFKEMANTWSLCQGEYAEEEWGTWWSENGEIYINDHFGLVVDGLYYKIVSLTESRLVIHVWGGFAGTPYEKGYDEEYKKLSNKPNNNGI